MSRILIIDDDFNLLQMVKLMLERVGHEVETARDGEKGITLAGQTQPELAIIDVMMPDLSGYDVVRKLRHDPLTARIPIIILTARSQPMDKHMALEAGANAFLSKPVTAQELTERVEAVIRAGVNFRVHTGLLTEPIPPRSAGTAPPNGAPSVAPQETPPDSMPTLSPPPGLESRSESPEAPTSPPPAAPAPQITMPSTSPVVELSPRDSRPSRPNRLPIGAEDIAQPADVPPPRLPVITVISLRGGTGCTTIAVNLALALAKRGRLCITDLSNVGGHIQYHLHLKPAQHWGTLASMGDAPDPRVLTQTVVQHTASGISLLAAPPTPPDTMLSTIAAQNILRELASAYQQIIVDARGLDPAARGALTVSSAVVVVTSDDPPGVQTAAHLLNTLNGMAIDSGRIRVVLNHVRPMQDVPTATIQKALKRPLSVEIPFDGQQALAVRRGTPLVVARPDSPFSQAVKQLARTITL